MIDKIIYTEKKQFLFLTIRHMIVMSVMQCHFDYTFSVGYYKTVSKKIKKNNNSKRNYQFRHNANNPTTWCLQYLFMPQSFFYDSIQLLVMASTSLYQTVINQYVIDQVSSNCLDISERITLVRNILCTTTLKTYFLDST